MIPTIIYFAIAWFLLVIFIGLEIYKRNNLRIQRIVQQSTKFQQLLIVGMLLYSMVGVFTADPLLTDILCKAKNVCLSQTYEWVIYVAILGYLIWKFILQDMKVDISNLKESNIVITNRLTGVETELKGVGKSLDMLLKKAKIKF